MTQAAEARFLVAVATLVCAAVMAAIVYRAHRRRRALEQRPWWAGRLAP